MPVPARIDYETGKLRITTEFKISISEVISPRLTPGITRMLLRLSGRTGLFLTQKQITNPDNDPDAGLQVSCKRAGKLELSESESYTLKVTPQKAYLNAVTDLGALRGLETFLQLLDGDDQGYYIPAVTIEDYPRFPWRGLMIDSARHFQPVEVIKRNLDGMAAVKLNVFHWHLTDDQGFRVESKQLPRLHQMGSDNLYYTREQIKEVVSYAADRGIRVVPEFDLPAHCTSWLVGYPELASYPGPYNIADRFKIYKTSINPVKEATYQFLDTFFAEMAGLFPDNYIHIGGDENIDDSWDQIPEIIKFKKINGLKNNHSLQIYFHNRLAAILAKYHKKVIGWDEIFDPKLAQDTVIESWQGKEPMFHAVRAGFPCILANGYYIDLMQPTEYYYGNDPLPEGSSLNDSQQKLILGGEVMMWSEFVTPETIDSRIWPRTAAIAERFWSPPNIRDVDDMYRRLDIISLQLEELGLTHERNYPMLLRRLTGNHDIEALKNLVDVVEPVKEYERHQRTQYTTYSPLTRVVDAARPDAQVARDFQRLIRQLLTDKMLDENKLKEAKSWLLLWKNNHNNLLQIIKQAPVLQEIKGLSEDLAKIAAAGLEGLDYIQTQKQAPDQWIEIKMALLDQARKPRGEVELMIIPAIRQIIEAAGEM
jgi:hexosaminidase